MSNMDETQDLGRRLIGDWQVTASLVKGRLINLAGSLFANASSTLRFGDSTLEWVTSDGVVKRYTWSCSLTPNHIEVARVDVGSSNSELWKVIFESQDQFRLFMPRVSVSGQREYDQEEFDVDVLVRLSGNLEEAANSSSLDVLPSESKVIHNPIGLSTEDGISREMRVREEVIREKPQLNSVPCTVVSWEHAESNEYSSFQLGGLPFRPKGASWPVQNGEPLVFIAQLDFGYACDLGLTRHFPGSIVQVFGTYPNVSYIETEWIGQPVDTMELARNVPSRVQLPRFLGKPHPFVDLVDTNSRPCLAGNNFVCTKLGGLPFDSESIGICTNAWAWRESVEPGLECYEFICAVGSINLSERVGGAEQGIQFGDYGCLELFHAGDGQIDFSISYP